MSKVAQSPLVQFFTAAQAARLAGLSLDMVNYLGRHEIVIASGSTSRGRGRPRYYTYADVLLLRVMARLLKQGISVLGLKKSMIAYRKRGGAQDLSLFRYFVTDGRNVYLREAGSLEDVASGQSSFAFVLDLQAVRREVEGAARKKPQLIA
ncbi:MerR family transcriptional regulator [Burkholderia gladioli]|uniref:MerR family transcriptional regulator n=1 Tax=Burkholderia gladioli TaxID=28095 RepID=UPI003D7C30F9